MTPEGRVKKAVRSWLHEHGLIQASEVAAALERGDPFSGWYYMPVQSRFSVKGIPDIVGVWRSVGFGIETKVPGNTPTDNQAQQLAAIEQAGGVSAVISDVSQLAEFLRQMESVWKRDTSKCQKPSWQPSKPTQSGASRRRPHPSTTRTSTASTAWIAATRSAKVAWALAGFGASTVNK